MPSARIVRLLLPCLALIVLACTDSRHYIHLEQPQVVIDAIGEVVDAAPPMKLARHLLFVCASILALALDPGASAQVSPRPDFANAIAKACETAWKAIKRRSGQRGDRGHKQAALKQKQAADAQELRGDVQGSPRFV